MSDRIAKIITIFISKFEPEGETEYISSILREDLEILFAEKFDSCVTLENAKDIFKIIIKMKDGKPYAFINTCDLKDRYEKFVENT